jgi:hypothetical protein
VIHADPRESGDFRIRENFLTGFDGNHGLGPLYVPPRLRSTLHSMLYAS